ncbi:hypothetical protein, partial [Neobacillus sp. GCM10023253]|uniref:hypothetical protein n=1 Tax=Neobacillus sp. GCM10023253 TaxID=3252644 RepID=UPI0036706427
MSNVDFLLMHGDGSRASLTLHFINKKRQPFSGCLFVARQRPTLTGTCVPTTIGAEKLNFRV